MTGCVGRLSRVDGLTSPGSRGRAGRGAGAQKTGRWWVSHPMEGMRALYTRERAHGERQKMKTIILDARLDYIVN